MACGEQIYFLKLNGIYSQYKTDLQVILNMWYRTPYRNTCVLSKIGYNGL